MNVNLALHFPARRRGAAYDLDVCYPARRTASCGTSRVRVIQHFIGLRFTQVGEAEQFIGRAAGGEHFNIVRYVQNIEDFCGELHASMLRLGWF